MSFRPKPREGKLTLNEFVSLSKPAAPNNLSEVQMVMHLEKLGYLVIKPH